MKILFFIFTALVTFSLPTYAVEPVFIDQPKISLPEILPPTPTKEATAPASDKPVTTQKLKAATATPAVEPTTKAQEKAPVVKKKKKKKSTQQAKGKKAKTAKATKGKAKKKSKKKG